MMAEHTPNAGVLELAKQLQQATDQRDALLETLEAIQHMARMEGYTSTTKAFGDIQDHVRAALALARSS